MPQKTIKEWLQELPEPYRTEALENFNTLREEGSTSTYFYLSDALFRAFSWRESNEGYQYWEGVRNKLISEGK